MPIHVVEDIDEYEELLDDNGKLAIFFTDNKSVKCREYGKLFIQLSHIYKDIKFLYVSQLVESTNYIFFENRIFSLPKLKIICDGEECNHYEETAKDNLEHEITALHEKAIEI
ncbi:hypothetical protein DL89DRAFT_313416 [Linderina pennispora]|uniref:Thioredoxin domain-containing protein n=1 Tax=Linderina pennispora TaxID=61395 RepID=A0A1Y1WD70_9FUNG|nr:uncharacterized protein DL89DRAFT_313416 [Linderina pennispora]ORX71288.1 hypothetical protein DL89DRAFT_313416 [Linderina pennispora]